MASKYPHATFSWSQGKLWEWLKAHPDENQDSILEAVRWYIRNGDRAGALSFPFVTDVDLGPSSR